MAVPPSNAPPTGFRQRFRVMRSERDNPWWSIVFGGPLGALLAAAVGEVRWITPNMLTVLAFTCRMTAAVGIVLGARGAAGCHDLIAVVCMQLAEILDCADGRLARYRRMPSAFGAFLDKVTDVVGLLAILGAFAWRVHADTGDELAMLLCAGAVMLWSARMYAFWVVVSLERDAGVPDPATSDGPRTRGELSLGGRMLYALRSTYWIFYFGEADAYFWLSLALLTGWLAPIAYLYGIGLGGWSIVVIIYWMLYARRLDGFTRDRVHGTRGAGAPGDGT